MITTNNTNCNSLENLIEKQFGGIHKVENSADLANILTSERRGELMEKMLRHCKNTSTRVGQFNKMLITTTLPSRDTGESTYKMKNGRQTMEIYTKAGNKLPSGTLPRLFLVYLCTEAIRTKSPIINLGSSLYDFMKKTGLDWKQGRGKNSDAKRFREQVRRMISCNIEITTEGNGQEAGHGMRIFKQWNFFWQSLDENVHSMFDNWVELSTEFYQHIIKNPLPVDVTSCATLKTSSLAFDLYLWLNHKVSTGKEVKVPIRCLASQLGKYKNPKDFKKPFRKALASVYVVWQELEFEIDDGLLILPKQKTHLQHLNLQEKAV